MVITRAIEAKETPAARKSCPIALIKICRLASLAETSRNPIGRRNNRQYGFDWLVA